MFQDVVKADLLRDAARRSGGQPIWVYDGEEKRANQNSDTTEESNEKEEDRVEVTGPIGKAEEEKINFDTRGHLIRIL